MLLREYIETRSIPVPFAGCWLWLLSFGSHGYGNASMPGSRVTTAHRVSFLAFKGPIPDGMLVQHSCDHAYPVLTQGVTDDAHARQAGSVRPTRRFREVHRTRGRHALHVQEVQRSGCSPKDARVLGRCV